MNADQHGPPDAPDGGPSDLGPLLRSCLPGLHAFVRLKFGPQLRAHEASADIVQSVCAEVLEHRDRFRHGGEDGFRAWLHRTAIRKIADRHAFWQAERRAADRVSSGLDPAAAEELLGAYGSVCTPSRDASAREQVDRIEAAFDRLSERHRDAIVEARILGRDRREMADERGITTVALRQLLARAMASLADELAEDG